MAGSLVKIDEEIVTSAVASVTLGGTDWDSSYDVYMVKLNGVIPVTAGSFYSRVTASGTPQTTANYDYASKLLRSDTTFGNRSGTNGTELPYNSGISIGADSTDGYNHIEYLFNFNNASEYSFGTKETTYFGSTNLSAGHQGGWVYTVAEAHNGIQYYFNTGNISSGQFVLYGLKK